MANTCAFCDKTDGMCYTSNPPKRKCTITGKFHHYDHICDVPQTNADRIRAMSDEELAEFLSEAKFYCQRNCEECLRGTACIPMLQWLKQPVEGE